VIAGYTCFIDGSVRDFQKHSVFAGKNFPATGPLGPWMVTADEIPDPQRLELTTRLNGTVVQHDTTDHMIFDVATIIEYVGERITWKEALRRHPHDPAQPNHTFYFHIDDKHVIDANVGGNAARWINHACDTNCEADEQDGRIFIKALRDIEPGEELFYDYGLVIEGRLTAKLKREYPCHCGSPNCRGTLLAPKRR